MYLKDNGFKFKFIMGLFLFAEFSCSVSGHMGHIYLNTIIITSYTANIIPSSGKIVQVLFYFNFFTVQAGGSGVKQ